MDAAMMAQVMTRLKYQQQQSGEWYESYILDLMRRGKYAGVLLDKMLGLTFCIEGPDGAGKTSLLNELVAPMNDDGVLCRRVGQPNGDATISPSGAVVRSWLGDKKKVGVTPGVFQAAMMTSWYELDAWMSSQDALRIASRKYLSREKAEVLLGKKMDEKYQETMITLVDRGPLSAIVYGTLDAIPGSQIKRWVENLPSYGMIILAPSLSTVKSRIQARGEVDLMIEDREKERPLYLDAICDAYRYIQMRQISYFTQLLEKAKVKLAERVKSTSYSTAMCSALGQYVQLGGQVIALLNALSGDAPLETSIVQTVQLLDLYMTLHYQNSAKSAVIPLRSQTDIRAEWQSHAEVTPSMRNMHAFTVPFSMYLQWMQEWAFVWEGHYSSEARDWAAQVALATKK